MRLRRGYDETAIPCASTATRCGPMATTTSAGAPSGAVSRPAASTSTSPVPHCPYLDVTTSTAKWSMWRRTLPDGSVRLAREVPYGSPAWEKRYGRRNLSESRNGLLQGMGLKRLPSFGLSRAHREVALGDLLENLRTLGRLVEEATTLALKDQPG